MGGGGMKVDKEKLKAQAKEHLQKRVMKVDVYDQQVWDIVRDVPRVNNVVAVIAAILNLILPGFGTIVAACASQGNDTVSKTQLTIGMVQFLTAFVLIGWFLSIYWGYLIVRKSYYPQNPGIGRYNDAGLIQSNSRGQQQQKMNLGGFDGQEPDDFNNQQQFMHN